MCHVPLISGHDNLRALVRADFIAGFRQQFDADRLARFRGGPPVMVPVVDKDPLAPSALPTADSWEWFTETRHRGLRHGAPAQGAGHPAGRSLGRLRQGFRRSQRAGA